MNNNKFNIILLKDKGILTNNCIDHYYANRGRYINYSSYGIRISIFDKKYI